MGGIISSWGLFKPAIALPEPEHSRHILFHSPGGFSAFHSCNNLLLELYIWLNLLSFPHSFLDCCTVKSLQPLCWTIKYCLLKGYFYIK